MTQKFKVEIDADFEEIVPMFLDNRRKDIDAIQSALDENNIKSIEVIAHKLAGNAGSYGFTELGTIGAKMEEACKSGEKEIIASLYENFKEYMKNVEVVYV